MNSPSPARACYPRTPLGAAWAVGVLLAILSLAYPCSAQVYVVNGDNIGEYNTLTGQAINADFISSAGLTGMAFQPDGDLYVASPTLPSAFYSAGITRYNASSGAALGDFATHLTDPALNNPAGIAFAPDGKLFVADVTAGSIFSYDSAGNHVGTFSAPPIGTPAGLAFDSSGTLYVADEGQGNVLRYSGGPFNIVNNVPGRFNAAHDVAVGGGSVFVLDVEAATSGVYKVSLADGSFQKIIDYSTSPFYAADMTLGPDGNLYVSGVDSDTGDGEVLRYETDGSGGSTFIDLGINANPGTILFAPVPEPSALALASLGGLAAFLRFRRQNSIALFNCPHCEQRERSTSGSSV